MAGEPAKQTLADLEGLDLPSLCRDLDLGPDCSSLQETVRGVRAAVDTGQPVDVALALLRAKIQHDEARNTTRRRAALLSLMVARGTARRHATLGFDAALLDL